MQVPNKESSPTENLEYLTDTIYPGDGLVVGLSESGSVHLVTWRFEQSEAAHSRFKDIGGGVLRTVMQDDHGTELYSFNTMRSVKPFRAGAIYHIVATSEAVDTVAKQLTSRNADLTYVADIDPIEDAHETRQVVGVVGVSKDKAHRRDLVVNIQMVARLPQSKIILGTMQSPGNVPIRRQLSTSFKKGVGLALHTYAGSVEERPSFNGKPYPVPLGATAEDSLGIYWDRLSRNYGEYLAGVAVKEIDIIALERTGLPIKDIDPTTLQRMVVKNTIES